MLDKARANLQRAGLPSTSLKQVDARRMAAPSATPGILSQIRRMANGSKCADATRAAKSAKDRATREGREDDEAFSRAQPRHRRIANFSISSAMH